MLISIFSYFIIDYINFSQPVYDYSEYKNEIDEFEKGQIAQINLLYYPADNVLLGTEFNWGQREDVDGHTGTDHRIQFTLKISFDTGDLMRTK